MQVLTPSGADQNESNLEVYDSMINEADPNGDGKITFNEFKDILMA